MAVSLYGEKIALGGIIQFSYFLNLSLVTFFYMFYASKRQPKNKALIRCANIFILLYIAYTITNGIITTSKSGPIFIAFFIVAFLHYTRRKVRFKELFYFIVYWYIYHDNVYFSQDSSKPPFL